MLRGTKRFVTQITRTSTRRLARKRFTTTSLKTRSSRLIHRPPRLLQTQTRFTQTDDSIPPTPLPDIDASALITTLTDAPKPIPTTEEELADLKFGVEFTDHMLDIDWDNKTGWHTPTIHPYQNFSLSPAASSLHYAIEAFEGLKAYIGQHGDVRLFRPDMNVRRLLRSCECLYLPSFDGQQFLECLYQLLDLEKGWIPRKDGYSLYIRPTIISTHPFIGVAPSQAVKLYVILSPVGPYYPEGFKAVTLLADNKYIRAWPRGTGNNKIGGNYGPTIRAQMEAAASGFSQVMWLFGEEDYVTEVGTMNQFFFWEKADGTGKELITAPLDGTILPGVTRDSILTLAKEIGEFDVVERPFTMSEVVSAVNEERMLEAFGAGTAAIISPVKEIGYKGKRYKIPLDPEDPMEEAGPLAKKLYTTLTDIQYGRVSHPWSVQLGDQIEI